MVYPVFKEMLKLVNLEWGGSGRHRRFSHSFSYCIVYEFLIVFKVFYVLIFHKPSLSREHVLHISGVVVHFTLYNAFNSCELVLGWRGGWFPDHGNKGMCLWHPEHQFLFPGVFPGVSRCSKSHGGVYGSPVCHQYSLICPCNCFQQATEVGADPTKQQI